MTTTMMIFMLLFTQGRSINNTFSLCNRHSVNKYVNFSDQMVNVKEKAKNLIPEVYNVQFHFYKNNLPKLPNGKYDGVTLIKTTDV